VGPYGPGATCSVLSSSSDRPTTAAVSHHTQNGGARETTGLGPTAKPERSALLPATPQKWSLSLGTLAQCWLVAPASHQGGHWFRVSSVTRVSNPKPSSPKPTARRVCLSARKRPAIEPGCPARSGKTWATRPSRRLQQLSSEPAVRASHGLPWHGRSNAKTAARVLHL